MTIRPLPYRKMAKRLHKLGFSPIRQRGSHVFFKHSDGRGTIVPRHPGEDISKGLIYKILKDLDINPEEFFKGD